MVQLCFKVTVSFSVFAVTECAASLLSSLYFLLSFFIASRLSSLWSYDPCRSGRSPSSLKMKISLCNSFSHQLLMSEGCDSLQKLAIKFPAVLDTGFKEPGPVLLQRSLQTHNVQSSTLVLIWVSAWGGRLPVERPELWAADERKGVFRGPFGSVFGRLGWADLAFAPNKHALLIIARQWGENLFPGPNNELLRIKASH